MTKDETESKHLRMVDSMVMNVVMNKKIIERCEKKKKECKLPSER